MLASKLLSSIGNTDKLYVDDVFSAYTYTGNGSTQTINNGIDLAGEGGLVWVAARSSAYGHYLFDTARGIPNRLATHNTNAQASITPAFVSSFNSNGFSTQSDVASTALQTNGLSGIAWTFRKAQKFFDVVTFTGDGAGNRSIAHSLGVAPGMVILKRTDSTSHWYIYHRSLGNNYNLGFTTDEAATPSGAWGTTDPTASIVTFGSGVNVNGASYVAYIFAHDPSAGGIIQCGSWASSGGKGVPVDLGWEPQFVLVKQTNTEGNWQIFDQARGMTVSGADNWLVPNLPDAESSYELITPSSTGFTLNGYGSQNGIYLAIRRPNKPPTTGTQVYNAIARTGTGAAATVTGVGFAPDLVIYKSRSNAITSGWQTRLQGGSPRLDSSITGTETPDNELDFGATMDGIRVLSGDGVINFSTFTYINHFFRRSPGFMDVVCDTGTGVAHMIAHNLAKAPELIIRKSRSTATQWEVWHSALAATEKLVLNSSAAKVTDVTAWGSTLPTATQFTVGTGVNVNANAATFVTYLFSTLPGISKVGSYSGNGGTQTIPCGFTTGSRFVLIKRIDNTGDWYVWDTARGIVSANDPHLSLNTTAAEVTNNDSVDPDSTGFIVNQVTATNINVTGSTYLYLAIA